MANRDELEATYTIRELAKGAKADTDLALIDVTRGKYDGVALSLATPTQLRERLSTAARAYQRETIRKGARVVVR